MTYNSTSHNLLKRHEDTEVDRQTAAHRSTIHNTQDIATTRYASDIKWTLNKTHEICTGFTSITVTKPKSAYWA